MYNNIVAKLVFIFSLNVVFIEPIIIHARSIENYDLGPVDHLVTFLPGQPPVNFRHYAGHITIDEKHGSALFYLFYEATTLPDQKPLLLWLNGGPGCSSVGYGATQEIGPFLVNRDGRSLKFNSFSWNTEANIIFLESPIGVGFSYTNTSNDYDNLGDDFTAKHAYIFLNKWFLKFPSYRKRNFYIAGESYAGRYLPQLAEVIMNNNKNLSSFIDLRGVLVGNPEMDDAEDMKGYVDYAWSHAVISDETHNIIAKYCDFYSSDPWENSNCSDGVDEIYRQYEEIDVYSLYTPTCMHDPSNMTKMDGYDPCLDDYAISYYNRPEVQKALHVSDGIELRNWSICNMTIYDHWVYSKPTVLPIYRELIDAKLRIWVYSGDTDGRVPVLSTRYSLHSLGLPIEKPWKPWYHQKQVGGWVQEYEGVTFATVKGAGHDVPTFKPGESLKLFASFLAGKPLPSER